MSFWAGVCVGIVVGLSGLLGVAFSTVLIIDYRNWNKGKCKEHGSYWVHSHNSPELNDPIYKCNRGKCTMKLYHYRKTKPLTPSEVFHQTIK